MINNKEKSSFKNKKSTCLQERESELAQIRSRFQKGKTVWENKDKQADETHTDNKVGFRYTHTLLVPNCPNLTALTAGFHLFIWLIIY